MEIIQQSITVKEPVTYNTRIMTGVEGPTLQGAYELNEWPVSQCQPFIGDHELLKEQHFLIRKEWDYRHFTIKGKTWEEANMEPTWFMGGIDKEIKVSYWPRLPEDAEAFGIKDKEINKAKSSLWIQSVIRMSVLHIDLPKQVIAEVDRAEKSNLYQSYRIGEPTFIAVSFDWRIFDMAPIKKPDPIIIGHGIDGKWHVIAAWNIDLDLAVIAKK